MLKLRSNVVSGLIAAAITGTIACAAPAAWAHDVVIGGDPADKEVLQEFPEVLSLEFSGYVKEDFNTFALSNATTDEILFTGEPTVDGRWVTLQVPEDIEAGEGDYRIGFQITSSDGHSTRGMTTFTVAGETSDDPADAPGASSAADDSDAAEPSGETADSDATTLVEGPMSWVLAGVGILAILGVIVMMIAKGRNNTQE
ncbi:copper resistance CopC family protein [Corynebacterium alimapuense]|uniref:CopC domain-containing protein n=1 Tax=Corynebacterium alimapuense TaxID=1576874 RepID=A0A3M8K8S0_9CORY|nr:copper resistance CopC family protein [Corynebacterium alimapuense]RNE49279.1 hypothetical protein C5L39_02570 [Corynebacterium alimapuense]